MYTYSGSGSKLRNLITGLDNEAGGRYYKKQTNKKTWSADVNSYIKGPEDTQIHLFLNATTVLKVYLLLGFSASKCLTSPKPLI